MNYIKVFAFVISTVILLYFSDNLFTFLIRKDDFNKVWWTSKIKNQSFDFALLGNSRVYTMAETAKLEEKWEKNGINLAVDGTNIMQHYLIISSFINNKNKIKDLFLNVDLFALGSEPNSEFRVWCFLPYIENDDVFKELANIYGYRAYLWRYVPFYRYAEFNSKIGPMTLANSVAKVIKRPFNDKGDFGKHSLESIDALTTHSIEKQSHKINSNSLKYFELILKKCNENNIKLHIYTAPIYYTYYQSFTNNNEIINTIINPLCKKYKADYSNFCNSNICVNHKEFLDHIHLNKFGLENFTNIMANHFKENKNFEAYH